MCSIVGQRVAQSGTDCVQRKVFDPVSHHAGYFFKVEAIMRFDGFYGSMIPYWTKRNLMSRLDIFENDVADQPTINNQFR